MSSLKQPPEFDPSGGDSYTEWKNDLAVWLKFTKEEKKRQGPALYLCLKGEAREAVRSIDVEAIAEVTGVETIIAALDNIFLKDETTRAFCAFGEFVEYRRGSDGNYTKFILEFEKRYREVKKHDLTLNDKVQAYFLLKAANLTDDHERLVRTTATLNYKDMKEKLQKVFGDFTDDSKSNSLPVKKEDCLYADERKSKTEDCFYSSEGKRFFQYNQGNRRGKYSSRGSNSSRGNFKYRGSARSGYHYDTENKERSGRSGYQYDADDKGRTGNPCGADGKIMRCHECDSTKHFVTECPHRKVEDTKLTLHITLVAGAGETEQQVMLAETLGKGILDSACTKTVAGTVWVEEFLSLLNESERKRIKQSSRPSSSLFRFGDGKESRSMKTMLLPICIVGKKTEIEVDIVSNEIPLLISKPTMTQLGMSIDFAKDELCMNGKIQVLKSNSSGHYILPVCEWADENCNVVLHLEHFKKLSTKEKQTKAMKIHRQFAHATKEPLIRLIKNGGCNDREFLDLVKTACETCEFCMKYRKPKLRPIVALPKGESFNEKVCMDLKEVVKSKLWILHLVDSTTRYTAACLIDTKKKEVVVTRIVQIWLAYFGAPMKIHSDCGGEFCNELLRELNEKFGIETSTTPGEAPYSNGMVERNNAVLYESMMKTKADVKCSMEMALAWSVSAKNALQNVYGYSPNQLVFGRNVNLPSVITSQLPALDSTCYSDIVRQNLDSMHKARQNFIKAESSERVMKSLRHKVRTYAEEEFKSGDKVLYLARRGRKGWRGPAKVLGKESNFVLIRHGDAYYRCHPCQLTKVEETHVPETNDLEIKAKSQSEHRQRKKDTIRDVESDTSSEDESKDGNDITNGVDIEREADGEQNTISDKESTIGRMNGVDIESDTDGEQNATPNNESFEFPNEVSAERQKKDEDDEDNPGDSSEINEMLLDTKMRPKPNSTVQFMMHDGEIKKAKVLSRQPKSTGRSKNWLNVKLVGDDEPSSVDWSRIQWWRKIVQPAQVLMLSSTDEYKQDIMNAKMKELHNLEENKVFDWVKDEGQQAVSSKWVITEKDNEDGSKRLKARLVARGFEENLVNHKTDSPTCSRQALRIVFVIASSKSWELHSLDITAAFLQGNIISRKVFVKPPRDFAQKGMLWLLKRCLYGLADAPREWYNRVLEVLTDLGAKVSRYDKSLFIWHDDKGRLIGVLVSHVDDFVYCGILDWHNKVISKLVLTFQISKQEKGSFKYLGLNLQQTGSEIYIDQTGYIQSLQEIKIDTDRKKQLDEKLNEKELHDLRSASGQLLWATSQTRPDMAYYSCKAGNYGNNASVRSLVEVNRTIKRLKSENLKLMYPNLGRTDLMEIMVHADASHASLPNGGSQGAWIVFVTGNNRLAPIEWSSKKLDRITKSPIASEASALADAGDVGWLAANILKEICNLKETPRIRCYSDSKSLKDHLSSTKVIQDARLRVDAGRLREMISEEEIEVRWIPGKDQLADCLTKNGASTVRLLNVLRNGTF